MKKIKGLLLLLSTMMLFVLAACGGDTTTEEPDNSTPEENAEENATEETDSSALVEGKVFTLEELSEYDGKDGNPAYVAVDGVVYDLTNIGVWSDGEHFAGISAGRDLTKEISASPHGSSVLENLPIVGSLED